MSTSVASSTPAPSRRPRGPKRQPPRARLYSTNSPGLGRPQLITSSTKPGAQTRTTITFTCPNTECETPNVVQEDDGSRVCHSCGSIASEFAQIVSEVQFGETASGAAAVQGQYVASDQTHARTGVRGQRPGFGAAGVDAMNSRQLTELTARRAMRALVTQLQLKHIRVAENLIEPGLGIFKLSLAQNFVQGRSINTVAAVAFYIQCRRDKWSNEVMLIDIAECIEVNVFVLGKIYTKMVQKIWGTASGGLDEKSKIETINPENLIKRFAKQLEFTPDMISKVTRDAIRLVQRMDRDWMATGRRPAGICGAALVLAARMNNFRRTVREVVLVVKVTEITINKRLEEFKYTESSSLTVEQFRNITLERDCDPPAFYLPKQEEKPGKRGRKRKLAPETAAEIEGDDQDSNRPGQREGEATAEKRPRLDPDGFVIPEIPIDPALRPHFTRRSNAIRGIGDEMPRGTPTVPTSQVEQPIDEALTLAVNSAISEMENQQASGNSPDPSSTTELAGAQSRYTRSSAQEMEAEAPRRRSGRPKGTKNWKPPPPTAAELALEAEIEDEMLRVLEGNLMHPAASSLSPGYANLSPSSRREGFSSSTSASRSDRRRSPVMTRAGQAGLETLPQSSITFTPNMSEMISEDEFDSDPEVAACLLTPEEIEIKERIWVSENADWLRKDHAKKIRLQLQEAANREAGISPEDAKAGKGRKKRRRGRLGDVSYLDKDRADGGTADGENEGAENGEGEDSATGGRRARSVSQAVRGMMEHRGYSKRINYDILATMFPEEEEERRRRESSEASRAISGSAGSRASPRSSRGGSITLDKETAPASSGEANPTVTLDNPTTSSPPVPDTTATTPPSTRPQRPRRVISDVPVPIQEPGKPVPSSIAPGSRLATNRSRGRAPGGRAGFEQRQARRHTRAVIADNIAAAEEEEEEIAGVQSQLEERSWLPRRVPGGPKGVDVLKDSTAAVQQAPPKPKKQLPTPLATQTRSAVLSAPQIGEEEVVGSIDDSPLSSLPSSANSPFVGVAVGSGFGGAGDDDDDDDESEGDEDDYIADNNAGDDDDDVLEAAFQGRLRPHREDGSTDDDDDEDEDEDEDDDDAEQE